MGYEIYGLKENPFPRGGAIIKSESPDPRENGQIFSVNARRREIQEFEEKFIGTKASFQDRLRCGFLWAEGDRTTGRGMGKTALALYMRNKINRDYGRSYFNGRHKFFASYISFREQIKSKMAYLYKEGFRSFIKEGLFAHVASQVSEAQLVESGVQDALARAISNNKVKEYLESLSKYPLDAMSTAWDQKFTSILPDLFLNQTVRALKAAGFDGGILIIDDIENLTDRSTRAEIENFVKDLGLAFFRAGYEAANTNFYTLVLTTHQQSAQKISQAWTVAGLATSFPLSDGGPASVLTRKPDLEQCIDIVVQYLRFYRDPQFVNGDDLYPFKRDAVEKVIRECDFHPRRYLTRLNRILVEAVGNGVKEITTEFVDSVSEEEGEEPEPGIADL